MDRTLLQELNDLFCVIDVKNDLEKKFRSFTGGKGRITFIFCN